MAIHGQCFCGAVRIRIDGTPTVQVYCHCESCRAWSGQPVTACVLFEHDDVHFVQGLDHVHRFSKKGDPEEGKFSCTRCGGSIGTFIPRTRQFDIFAGLLKDFTFQPTAHINYGEGVLHVRDGLPKFRDMPARAGGSGALMDE